MKLKQQEKLLNSKRSESWKKTALPKPKKLRS